MRRTFRSAAGLITILSLAMLVACGAPSGAPNASKPSVKFSLTTGATVSALETIRVTVTDNEHNVKSIKVVLVDLENTEISTLADVVFDVLKASATVDFALDNHVAASLESGASYRLLATATNGANRVGTLQIGIVFADSPPGDGPSEPGTPTDPDTGLPPLAAFWELPHMGSTLVGTVNLQALLPGNETITAVRFELLSEGDRTLLTGIVNDGSGRYSSTLDTTLYGGGDYVLQATFIASTGAVGIAARPITIAPQLPKVRFLAPSPTPNQRLAGIVRYQLAIEAPRGFESLAVDLVQGEAVTEMARYEGLSDVATVSGAFVTLDIEPGSYDVVATITDALNNEASYTIPVELLPIFTMTTPEDGAGVGLSNQKQLVAVTVGITGAVRSDLDITSAAFFVNGVLNATGVVVDEGADNFLVLYMWDTDEPGPGHDPAVNGDRHLTFLLNYEYEDADGVPQTGSLFTPPILVDYQP